MAFGIFTIRQLHASLIMDIYLNFSISNYLAFRNTWDFPCLTNTPHSTPEFPQKTNCMFTQTKTLNIQALVLNEHGCICIRCHYSLETVFFHSCPTVRTNNSRSAADETAETATGAGTCERTACAGLVWCFGMTHRLTGLATAQFGPSVHVSTFHPQVFSPSRIRHSLQLHFSVNP